MIVESSPGRAMERSAEFLETLFGERFLDGFSVRFWDGTVLPSRSVESAFTFLVNEPTALRSAFAFPIDLNAGRAFVEGALDVEGDVRAAIVAMDAANNARTAAQTVRIVYLLTRLPRPAHRNGDAMQARLSGAEHSKERDRAAIAHHYDHPVEFYASFLGPELVYSCAYYDDGVTNLQDAQRAKLDYILRKLRI